MSLNGRYFFYIYAPCASTYLVDDAHEIEWNVCPDGCAVFHNLAVKASYSVLLLLSSY